MIFFDNMLIYFLYIETFQNQKIKIKVLIQIYQYDTFMNI